MTNILVIDTATEACSVALQVEQQVFNRYEVCPQQHSQRVLPMVDEVLAEANVQLQDLEVIAYGHGPGSFTGVRIASGIIQGLAIGTELPVIGISTLAAMAQQVFELTANQSVHVAIDARMNEVYYGHYKTKSGIMCQTKPEIVANPCDVNQTFDTSQPLVTAGTGWAAYPELTEGVDLALTDVIAYPNARYMLPIASELYRQGAAVAVEESQPVYLRDKVTWKKLPGR